MHVHPRRAALAGALALATAIGIGAPAADAAGSGPRLATKSQQSIVSARALVVRTTVPKRSTAVLRATSGKKAISRSVKVPAGKASVAVPLTAAGVKLVATCTPRTIALTLTTRAKGKKARTTKASAKLVVDRAACKGQLIDTDRPSVPVAPPAVTVTTPAPPAVTVTTTTPTTTTPAPPRAPEIDVSKADRCDFLTDDCLKPFPNDYFTAADSSTATGRRLDIDLASMPANKDGVHIDPTDINRGDGFSGGSVIQVHVPGFDTPAAYAATDPVPVNDVARSYDAGQPIVVIDADTGARQLIWSELDANATTAADTDLEIHPATQLQEGHRYIVALRDLKNAAGDTIPAGDAFRTYRDDLVSDQPEVEARRDHMDALLSTLTKAGIDRDSLYLAWDFTVASAQSITGRMLSIRDRAFAALGDHDLADLDVQGSAPSYTITATTNFTSTAGVGNYNKYWGRRIEGTFTVPCYLKNRIGGADCGPGSTFDLGSDGMPIQHGTTEETFICNIPHSVVDGAPGTTGRPTMYGHGLFGGVGQVNGDKRGMQATAQGGPLVMCATEFKGMASDDEGLAAGYILPDMSHMNMMADRLQQGLLNFLFLGRLMIHPNGFAANASFQNGGKPMIDTRRLNYTGVSEGGILGGALTAIAPDFTRAALVVPGMNYSVLLPRSTDFADFKPYFSGLAGGGYAVGSQQALVLSLAQLLWDRGEPNGYVHHMTDDPLPNTPRHKVLFSGAFGDHQVSNVTLETEARTLGARVRTPIFDPGRSLDVTPFYGIPAISSWPYGGSASVVMTDIGPARAGGLGTLPAPLTNTAPSDDPDSNGFGGVDPHGYGGQEQVAADQIAQFLDIGGQVVDTCGAGPCHAGGWTGS